MVIKIETSIGNRRFISRILWDWMAGWWFDGGVAIHLWWYMMFGKPWHNWLEVWNIVYFFHIYIYIHIYIGFLIIPTDEVIFFKGVAQARQAPTSTNQMGGVLSEFFIIVIWWDFTQGCWMGCWGLLGSSLMIREWIIPSFPAWNAPVSIMLLLFGFDGALATIIGLCFGGYDWEILVDWLRNSGLHYLLVTMIVYDRET